MPDIGKVDFDRTEIDLAYTQDDSQVYRITHLDDKARAFLEQLQPGHIFFLRNNKNKEVKLLVKDIKHEDVISCTAVAAK